MSNDRLPRFSVIICTRNEEKYISRCIDSLLSNNYPSNLVQVLVCDGKSTDNTRRIVKHYAREHTHIQLLDNPRLTTPYGFNLGIDNANSDIIAVLSAHSEVAPDWIEKNVYALYKHPEVEGVGGLMTTVGDDYRGNAISLALSSTFGVGNSSFRVGAKPGYVDTIVFGAYRRTTFEKYGKFDEELSRNQDDEFNYRINWKGGKLWFDPRIKSKYFSRYSVWGVLRQFAQYGFWKPLVFKKCPGVFAWRQLIPPLFVLTSITFAVAAIIWPVFWWMLIAISMLYFLFSGLFAVRIALQSGLRYLPLLPIIFLMVHFAYGLNFLYGIFYFLVLGLSVKSRHAALTR
jgi:glycosyltransferase involved in cell wall biosynthesis